MVHQLLLQPSTVCGPSGRTGVTAVNPVEEVTKLGPGQNKLKLRMVEKYVQALQVIPHHATMLNAVSIKQTFCLQNYPRNEI